MMVWEREHITNLGHHRDNPRLWKEVLGFSVEPVISVTLRIKVNEGGGRGELL